MVVLLSGRVSLTARETLTVLGSGGVRADALTWGGLTIGLFSRWRRRLIGAPPPGADPFGYLSLVSALCSAGEYEAVLATHGQAWLFAAGIRTRSTLALAHGAAERSRSRAAVLRVLRDCALRRGETGRAAEILTPVLRDPPSAVPLTAVALLLLADPGRATALAGGAVRSYSISPATVALVRAAAAD